MAAHTAHTARGGAAMKKRKIRFRRSTLLAAGVFAVLVGAACLLPTEAKFHLHTQGALHPWIHLIVFGTLAALCTLAAPQGRRQILLLIANLLFAWGTEWVESLRDGWPVERHDVLLDSVGIVVGFLLANAWLARPRRIRPNVDFPQGHA